MVQVQVDQYHLFPTGLVPNSPQPLLHYKNVLSKSADGNQCNPAEVWDLFTRNEWRVEWIFRYGPTQLSHFHSKAHECMAVLSGTATIRFGVGDTSDNLEANTYGSAWEEGGVELSATAGDVFVIPAGIAHKTYNTQPQAEFRLLSPGNGHGIDSQHRKALEEIELSGYTMMGAYSGGNWDFIQRGGNFQDSWIVPKPSLDPVFGSSDQGLVKTWSGRDMAPEGFEVSYENGVAVRRALGGREKHKARL